MNDFSIVNTVLCTQPDMFYAIKVMSIYQSDAYDDHWTIVKIFLCTLEELRICLYAEVTNSSL